MAHNTFDIEELLKIYGASPGYRPQFEHRVNIVKSWNILPGSRILEVGPGQGDCTIVLATAVGESGHVDAVDPAPLNYGTPFLYPILALKISSSSTISHPSAQVPPPLSANPKPGCPHLLSVLASAGSKTLQNTTSQQSRHSKTTTHTSSSFTPSGTFLHPPPFLPSCAFSTSTPPQTRTSASPNMPSVPHLYPPCRMF